MLFADRQQQKGQQERSSRASPLPQHDNFGPGSTPLAEGEELVDDPPRFAHELLPAELQLLVALQNGRLRLPEVLDGGRVEGVGCGQPPDKVLELICKARQTRTVMTFPFFFSFVFCLKVQHRPDLIQSELIQSKMGESPHKGQHLLESYRAKAGTILHDAYANGERHG